MSISYTIAYNCISELKNVGQQIETLGFTFDPKHGGRHPMVPTMTYFCNSLIIDLVEEDSFGKEIFSDELGININQKIMISVPDDISYKDLNTLKIINLVVELCSHCEDLVFLFNGEKVLLLKKNSSIKLDSESLIWTEQNQTIIRDHCGLYERSILPII